jgi:galactokinase
MSLSLVAKRALNAFATVFQTQPQGAVHAPGRVNLIGEHTDYNDGWVLPCAIDRGTVIAVRKRSDMRVRVVAVDYGLELDEFRLDALILREDSKPWCSVAKLSRGWIWPFQATSPKAPGCHRRPRWKWQWGRRFGSAVCCIRLEKPI